MLFLVLTVQVCQHAAILALFSFTCYEQNELQIAICYIGIALIKCLNCRKYLMIWEQNKTSIKTFWNFGTHKITKALYENIFQKSTIKQYIRLESKASEIIRLTRHRWRYSHFVKKRGHHETFESKNREKKEHPHDPVRL